MPGKQQQAQQWDIKPSTACEEVKRSADRNRLCHETSSSQPGHKCGAWTAGFHFSPLQGANTRLRSVPFHVPLKQAGKPKAATGMKSCKSAYVWVPQEEDTPCFSSPHSCLEGVVTPQLGPACFSGGTQGEITDKVKRRRDSAKSKELQRDWKYTRTHTHRGRTVLCVCVQIIEPQKGRDDDRFLLPWLSALLGSVRADNVGAC